MCIVYIFTFIFRSIMIQSSNLKAEDVRYIVLYLQRESRKDASDQHCVDIIQLFLSLLQQKVFLPFIFNLFCFVLPFEILG